MTNTIAAIVFSILVTNTMDYREQGQSYYAINVPAVLGQPSDTPSPPQRGWTEETVSSNLVARVVFDGKTNDIVLDRVPLLSRRFDWQDRTEKKTIRDVTSTNEWQEVFQFGHATTNSGWIPILEGSLLRKGY